MMGNGHEFLRACGREYFPLAAVVPVYWPNYLNGIIGHGRLSRGQS